MTPYIAGMAKTARLDLRLDPDLKARVDAEADRLGQKVTTFVERALEDALSEDHAPVSPQLKRAMRESWDSAWLEKNLKEPTPIPSVPPEGFGVPEKPARSKPKLPAGVVKASALVCPQHPDGGREKNRGGWWCKEPGCTTRLGNA